MRLSRATRSSPSCPRSRLHDMHVQPRKVWVAWQCSKQTAFPVHPGTSHISGQGYGAGGSPRCLRCVSLRHSIQPPLGCHPLVCPRLHGAFDSVSFRTCSSRHSRHLPFGLRPLVCPRLQGVFAATSFRRDSLTHSVHWPLEFRPLACPYLQGAFVPARFCLLLRRASFAHSMQSPLEFRPPACPYLHGAFVSASFRWRSFLHSRHLPCASRVVWPRLHGAFVSASLRLLSFRHSMQCPLGCRPPVWPCLQGRSARGFLASCFIPSPSPWPGRCPYLGSPAPAGEAALRPMALGAPSTDASFVCRLSVGPWVS
jgi:hypothetical protein